MDLVDHGAAILEWPQALSADQCASLIKTFEDEPAVRPGVVMRSDGREELDAELKRSEDYLIESTSPADWLELDQMLGGVLARGVKQYFDHYPWLPKVPTTFCGFQLQRTSPGEGFGWHADEDGRRRLAIIFYLNDDFEGGATEFQHQRLVYHPKRGSMLMFPPYWTHVHRGCNVEAGQKYIVTSFLMRERQEA